MKELTKQNLDWIVQNWDVPNPISAFRDYSPTEVIKILGLKHHHVVNMVEKQIIRPKVSVSGRGKSRVYAYSNLFEICFFYHLVRRGHSHISAKKTLKSLGHLPEDASIFNLLFVTHKFFYAPLFDAEHNEVWNSPANDVMRGPLVDHKKLLKERAFNAAHIEVFSLNIYDLAGINHELLNKI